MENKKTDKKTMLKVGSELRNNTYRIDANLPSGGFGNTYIATHIKFEETVAIKEFFMKGISERDENTTAVKVSNTDNTDLFNRQRMVFEREAKRLRKLGKYHNPHIVKVQDIFDENGTTYYVMEYINGKSLGEIMKEQKIPFDTQWLLTTVLPHVLDALDVVHSQNMWHLDIKPSNIMLDQNQNCVLIDFGSSKQIDPSIENPNTILTMASYTPRYAPSELQDFSIKRIGPWSDLYELGATLYNLGTNNVPPTPSEINNDKLDAFKFPDAIEDEFKQLVVWLMRQRTGDRPQSVAEVKSALENGTLPPLVDATPMHNNIDAAASQDEETVLDNSGNSAQPISNSVDEEGGFVPSQPQPFKSPEHEPEFPEIPEIPEKPNRRLWWIYSILGFVAVAIISGLIAGKLMQPKQTTVTTGDSTVVAAKDTVQVTDFTYSSNQNEKVLTFKYTGPLVENVPNGVGKGVYDEGIFEGPFVNGIRHGENCTFTYTASGESKGDVYKGGFKNGLLDGKCKYTQNDGYYFVGTAKRGELLEGDWYDKNGKHVSRVVNGKEIHDKGSASSTTQATTHEVDSVQGA